MSQLSSVAKVLRRNTAIPGITVAAIARKAGVPREAVAKRIYDLRQEDGREIYTNYRTVNGKKKTFYRLAA